MASSAQSATAPAVQDQDHPTVAYLPFREEVFEETTKKQLFILVAARDAVMRDDTSQALIADIANVSEKYPRVALTKFIHRKDLPAAYNFAQNLVSRKSYEDGDLTKTQRDIINETVVNPHLTQREISNKVGPTSDGCSARFVHETQRLYNDIIQEKNMRDADIDTPVVTSDVPVDDLLKDHRNQIPIHPNEMPMGLINPFSKDLFDTADADTRFALLVAREWAVRGKPNTVAVARATELSDATIRRRIGQFRGMDEEYPIAAAVAKEYFPDMSYENATELQKIAINHKVANPDASPEDIAAQFTDLSENYAYNITKQFNGIINQQRTAL